MGQLAKVATIAMTHQLDDMVSVSSWVARGIKIHGKVEITETNGLDYMVILPQRSWCWGIMVPVKMIEAVRRIF